MTIRGHRKYRREGGNKNCDRVGGKNMASGRGTNSWDREGGTFEKNKNNNFLAKLAVF